MPWWRDNQDYSLPCHWSMLYLIGVYTYGNKHSLLWCYLLLNPSTCNVTMEPTHLVVLQHIEHVQLCSDCHCGTSPCTYDFSWLNASYSYVTVPWTTLHCDVCCEVTFPCAFALSFTIMYTFEKKKKKCFCMIAFFN